jgi:large subunit ribosomal protein L22
VTGPKTNERDGTRAFLRSAPMSAFKIRVVLDLIRGEEVGRAAEILEFCERGPAEVVGKLLASAVANAANNDDLDPEELFVSACYADESKTMRRMRPRARGRATRIRKRSAHITVIVSRLPEDRLARLRAKRAADQASRRTRRGRGAAPARARRRRRPAEEVPVEDVAAVLHDHDHELDEVAEHDHEQDHEHGELVEEQDDEHDELVEELDVEHGALEDEGPADAGADDGEVEEADPAAAVTEEQASDRKAGKAEGSAE